jgi:hypothetical protein
MRANFLAGAVAAVIISGAGITHAGALRDITAEHGTAAASHSATAHPATATATKATATKTAITRTTSSSDPAMTWLESAGGQAQVTFNNEVSALAVDLQTESQSPTVANHLVFEADARVVRAEAEKILSTPDLLPTVNRAAYEKMLDDFITVANLLQPGPGYGTTAQDYAAWNTALAASNITVS